MSEEMIVKSRRERSVQIDIIGAIRRLHFLIIVN